MKQLQESFFNKYSDDFLGFIQDYTKNKLENREDYKKEISKNTLGIPVISIGVPTVSNLGALTKSEELCGLYVSPNDIDFTIESMSEIISASILNSLYKQT